MTLSATIKAKKAFIWDFDGCFCDSEYFHYLAYNKAFSHFGHQIPEAKYYPSFTHLGLGASAEIRNHNLACTVDEIMQFKHAYYREYIESKAITLFPETSLIVAKLKKLDAKIAIASNSSNAEIEAILHYQNATTLVDLIIGKTPELKKKPAPDLFLYAMKMLNCKATDALIFEDSNRGLEAAEQANCEAICLRTKYNNTLEMTAAHVAEMSHKDLLKFLGDIKPTKSNDPLHGVTLETMLQDLVKHYGWEKMGSQINIKCFNSDPSVPSSLKFLRRTPWARTKVESMYLTYLNEK